MSDRQKTILFIDESKDWPDYFHKKLKDHHIEVTVCSDYSVDAISLMSKQKFDLIIFHLSAHSDNGGSEWSIADRDWNILDKKEDTENSETPIFAIALDYDTSTVDRMLQSGVAKVFDAKDLSPEKLIEEIVQQLTS